MSTVPRGLQIYGTSFEADSVFELSKCPAINIKLCLCRREALILLQLSVVSIEVLLRIPGWRS